MTTFADIKNDAHKLLAKFQTGSITKESLYEEGISLTVQFNELADSLTEAQKTAAADNQDVQDISDLLSVIKHFSTC